MSFNNLPKEPQEKSFEIKEHIGVLSVYPTGWTQEVNIVSWYNSPAKIDIRQWNETHEKMSRGITFNAEQAIALIEILGPDVVRRLNEINGD